METNKMNIYQKLLNISNDIKPISKDMEVGKGYNSYKAVSEAQVKNEVKPIEFKYGVYSYPKEIQIVNQETITTESTYKEKTEEKTKFVVRALITFRFVNTDNPSDFVDMQTFGDGVDPLDKSAGKAMTYALKYGLINAYKMISGEDPDQFHSSDNEITKEKPRKKYEPSPNHQPPSNEEEEYEKQRKNLIMKATDFLEKEENAPYKAEVMQKMADKYDVDGFMRIRMNSGKEFLNEVYIELNNAKENDKEQEKLKEII